MVAASPCDLRSALRVTRGRAGPWAACTAAAAGACRGRRRGRTATY